MEVIRECTECPVCYAELIRPLQLSCGHTICNQCVDNLVSMERNGTPQAPDDEAMPMARRLQHQLQDIQRRVGLPGQYMGPAGPPMMVDQGPPPNNLNGNDGNNMGMQNVGLGGMHGGPNGYGRPPMPPQPHNQMMVYQMQPGPAQQQPRFFIEPWAPGMVPAPMPGRGGDMRGRRNSMSVRIRCPECRQQTDVPPGGLPTNYTLKTLIERLHDNRGQTKNIPAAACDECCKDIEKGIYFVCGACPDMRRICSLCIVRNHISHGQIIEHKSLTEQELAELTDKLNSEASRGHEVAYRIGDSLSGLNEDSRPLKESIEKDLQTYNRLHTDLRNIDRNTSRECAEEFVTRAAKVTFTFTQLENSISQLRADTVARMKEMITEYQRELAEMMPLAVVKPKTEMKQETEGDTPTRMSSRSTTVNTSQFSNEGNSGGERRRRRTPLLVQLSDDEQEEGEDNEEEINEDAEREDMADIVMNGGLIAHVNAMDVAREDDPLVVPVDAFAENNVPGDEANWEDGDNEVWGTPHPPLGPLGALIYAENHPPPNVVDMEVNVNLHNGNAPMDNVNGLIVRTLRLDLQRNLNRRGIRRIEDTGEDEELGEDGVRRKKRATETRRIHFHPTVDQSTSRRVILRTRTPRNSDQPGTSRDST